LVGISGKRRDPSRRGRTDDVTANWPARYVAFTHRFTGPLCPGSHPPFWYGML